MNELKVEARQILGAYFRDAVGEEENRPTFALAAKRIRAIDLSCRACDACGAGAECWAWIPGGGLRSAPVFTPNLRPGQKCVLTWGGSLFLPGAKFVLTCGDLVFTRAGFLPGACPPRRKNAE